MQLHTETFGTGPAVLLCHGFGGSARNFRVQARALESRFRVTLFDLRGHARSPAPEGAEAYRLPALLADLAELVEAAGTPLILGGLSLGAKLALDFALAEPGKVRALLLASYPSSGEEPKRRAWALGFAEAIDARGLDEAGAQFVWGERSRFDPKGAALIRQGFLEHSPQALAHILREVLASSPSPRTLAPGLQALSIPTCVVAGSDDPESLEPCRELARLLPQAELHVLEGAGHVVNLVKPAEFNDLLRSFLAPFA
ncbi:MAG TPA: alpha/beta hydrolase [Polyangiaceae bacterium]|nr:alpha/beta hydrolase [Polyangiaceae bacterium]